MKTSASCTLVSGLLCLATARGAAAQGLPVETAHLLPYGDAACWAADADGLWNACASPQVVEIPLAVGDAGLKHITVMARAWGPDEDVRCIAVETSEAGAAGASPLVGVSEFGTVRPISLAVYVPRDARLRVICLVAPGGEMRSVTWVP